jgi:hypothetical protein
MAVEAIYRLTTAAVRQLSRDISLTGAETLAKVERTGPQRITELAVTGERQKTSRQRSLGDRRHPASLTEPPGPHDRRYAGLRRRILTRQPTTDRRPEPLPMLPPRHRRPPR